MPKKKPDKNKAPINKRKFSTDNKIDNKRKKL